MSETEAIIKHLHEILDKEKNLAEVLQRSLAKAREVAQADLRPDLFDALEWPQNLEEYEAYLSRFVRWVPRQADSPPWQRLAADERHAKEVSDRMSHFFWLVDQKVDDDDGAVPQSFDVFKEWLNEFARRWGNFLDMTESFNPETLQSFIDNAPEYRVHESMINGKPNMPSGWLTFNQFFARELNAGLRPISEPGSNLVVTCPADCVFQQQYDIDAQSNIPATTIKHSHKYGNIKQLLEGSEYADRFAGGTFVHYELLPSSYHRYHLPVSGEVKESFVIHGKVFQQVDLVNGELESSDTATTGYEFFQTRGVVTIDTSASDGGDLGIVAVIPVGMAQVASVNLTAVESTRLYKGQQFGYFQFGGSDIIILFEPGVEVQVDTGEQYRLVGTPIARCRPRSA
jgi:phosphatidylserine decarboxylase